MANGNELIIRINGTAKDFLEEIDKVKKKTEDLEKVFDKVAKASAAAFAGFTAVIAGVTKSFANYETALVGVGKTTNISGDSLKKFGKEFQALASTIPISTNELLGIAQAAGQLGVEGEKNLLKFTETIAKLGVATDLTGEEAATSLTRILNVTNEGIESIDTFGSVIVALGNNFAATESEIVRVTTEVARSTTVFGVSAAEAAALGTALKSVGVQAQLGGSAVGRAFREIDASIREGGTSLQNLASITGIAADQLQSTFAEDSTAVFQAFINGLGEIQAAGGSTTEALEAFGLSGDEINKVLPVLAKNSELVGEALALAGQEAKNATALNEEAAKAFDTLASEAQLVRNNFTDVATNIGEQLAPAITGLLKSINEILVQIKNLDSSTLKTIATFLKWGAIISGVVAGLAAFLLGAIKVSALITAIGAAFLPATVAASAFWVALTGPIGIAVAGIVAITAGVVKLSNVLKKDEEPKTLQNINKELKELQATRDRVANNPNTRFVNNDKDLETLDKEIAKLKELQEEKIAATKDFGTGSLLIRPETDGTDPLAGLDKQLGQTQAIPLAPQEEQVENTKKAEAQKTAIVDESTQKRIDAAKRENAELLELQKARADGFTDTELEVLQRRQEIENEFSEARKIKNDQERALALQNLKLKHEEELAEIAEFEAEKDERDAERREERAALDAELRELDKEQQMAFDEEDKERLAAKIDTQKEAEKKAAEERLQTQIKERNQFKQDEIKFGTQIATLKKFFNKEEVQGFKSTSGQLAQLSQSRNSTLKGIGKAAARVNAAIKTAEGAISAYSALAGIPIIGPVLGAAAAAALIAFGVEQQSKISSAQTGGFVPPTSASGGARDRVPTLLEPGELVVPRAIAPNFVQSVGNPNNGDFNEGDSNGAGSGTGEMTVVLEGNKVDDDEYITSVAQKIKELREFDNVSIG